MKHTPTGPIETIELATMVDELAELKAMIAPLQEREQALKDALKASGRERIDGTEHTAVVSLSERETVDAKALRADLGEDIIRPYLRQTLVTVIKLTARKTH
jgi:hypothetical protein